MNLKYWKLYDCQLYFQFMKMNATSAVMVENFSCVIKEVVQSATTRTALEVKSPLVASGSAHGISVMTAASQQISCALNAQIPTVKLTHLVKSQS